MQAVVAATGAAAVGGCLGDDGDRVPEIEDDLQRYDLPAYSQLTPAETQAGGGMMFLHLRLGVLRAVQRASTAGRLPDGPLAELPLSGVKPVAEAVETLSSYPFAAPVRQSVNSAAGSLPEQGTFSTNRTLVDPGNESVDGHTTANRTNGQNETESGILPVESTAEGVLGIEVTELTLADELLIFHGSFDRQVIADRYTEGFQQADQQRELTLYEGVGDHSGLGFAVGETMLVVPTENSSREPAAETLLAHGVSSYINTLGRIVDDEDGQWLFETTGPAALSLGVWGADDPLGLITDSVDDRTAIPNRRGPVFDSVDSFITALDVTADNTGELSTVAGRFAGLFDEAVPTEDELRNSLVDDETAVETVVDPPRAHLTTTFDDS